MSSINLFSTLKPKPVTAYLILLIGFLFSLFININFVSERANDSLTEFQNEHAKLQAHTTFHNIQEFIKIRREVLAELAESTTIISSVMGIEVASINIIDLLSDKKILGSKENVFITDFTGKLIYPNTSDSFSQPHVFKSLMQNKSQFVLTIKEKNNQHFFSISMPVMHHNQIEGIITLDLISYPIDKLLAELTKDNVYATSFVNNDIYSLIYKTETLDQFSFVASSLIVDTPIEIKFYVSTNKLKKEKNKYIWQIGSTLAIATLTSFFVLVLIIRALLIKPLAALAESEQRVKLNEERYLLAVQGSNDGIWDWNIEKNKLYLSTRLLDMTGYDADLENELIDKDKLFFTYIHPDDRMKSSNAFIKHVKNNVPLDFDFRMLVANGTYKYFRVRGIALKNHNNRAVRMAGSLSDISELKEKTHELKKALVDAKSANIAKSDFLANMSHEIRTPMNGVLGTLQMLKREGLSDSSERLVNLGVSSSNALLAIINDILDLSKIESNSIHLEFINSNIKALLQTLHTELSLSAQEKNIQLTLSIAKDMPEYWSTDPVRLRQIIVNLVSNAIKFTQKGHVSIIVYQTNSGLNLKVEDTGVGIKKEQLSKIFNRFEQADSTTTRKFGGTGLGLPIAKKLINLMKGEITVTSEENKGSIFSVSLPLKASTSEKTKTISDVTLQFVAPNAEYLTILLAEDNKINQTIFKAVMAPTKAKITIANDGLEAVNIIRKQLPDLIFMDIQMPNMDGIEACKIIKKLQPNITVIALTANVMNEDVEKYKRSGFNYYLGKPLEVNKVYALLDELLYNPKK